jgi:hypothetical protein
MRQVDTHLAGSPLHPKTPPIKDDSLCRRSFLDGKLGIIFNGKRDVTHSLRDSGPFLEGDKCRAYRRDVGEERLEIGGRRSVRKIRNE